MKELSTDSLVVVMVFIIPGFVALKAWASVAVAPASNDKSLLLSAIAASACLYAPFSPLLYWEYTTHRLNPVVHPVAAAVTAFGVLCVWPAIAGVGVARVMRAGWWQHFASWLGVRPPELRAWDAFFSRGEQCFVRAVLKDGRIVGGLFVPGASASSYPASEDLYLAVQYSMDSSGTFGERMPRTRGCWLDMNNVQCLEFQSVEETDEQRREATHCETGAGREERNTLYASSEAIGRSDARTSRGAG
jgi:hypothetical protein